MSYQNILFEVTDGVARLTLNRPDRLNSFNTAMHAEVRDALGSLGAGGAAATGATGGAGAASRTGAMSAASTAAEARVLIITGAGRGFCAGQDLSDRAVSGGTGTGAEGTVGRVGSNAGSGSAPAPAAPPDLGDSIERYYKPLILALRRLPIPVIAAVNGVAAGAGANIALACDLVIAAKSASFVQAFSKLGLVPDAGGTWFLPRLVGNARAMGLAMLGEKLPAEEAAQWGLIWKCVDDAEFPTAVDALARQLAAAPTKGLARTKQAIYESSTHTLEQQLDIERDYQRELGRSADYAEGVAAFTEKRTARFSGK